MESENCSKLLFFGNSSKSFFLFIIFYLIILNKSFFFGRTGKGFWRSDGLKREVFFLKGSVEERLLPSWIDWFSFEWQTQRRLMDHHEEFRIIYFYFYFFLERRSSIPHFRRIYLVSWLSFSQKVARRSVEKRAFAFFSLRR